MRRLLFLALFALPSGCLFYDTSSVSLGEPSDAAEQPDGTVPSDAGGADGSSPADATLSDVDRPDGATVDMVAHDAPGDGGLDAGRRDAADDAGGSIDAGKDGGGEDAGDMAMPQFPPVGLEIWLSADDGVAVTMDKVNTWTDRTDGTTWAAPQISRRPTLVSNFVNGRPVLRFFGGQEARRDSGFETLPQMHVFVVTARAATVMGPGAIMSTWDPGQGDSLIRFDSEPTALHVASTTAGLNTDFTVADTTAFHLMEIVADATAVEIRQDGVTTATANYTNNGPFRISTIGQFRDSTFFRGDIAEIMVWNRPLTGLELTLVRQYLQTRYFP